MFIEEYLRDLRAERFSLGAIARYAQRVAARVREDLVANPSAVRSVWSVALGFIAAAFAASVGLALGAHRPLAQDFFLQTCLWILPAFGLVTVHVGMLRDRDGYRLSALNLPTVLTLLRIGMLPGIVLFLFERQFAIALALFVVAAFLDVADGWLARRWNQITRFGMVLDPLVDIVFNLTVFAALQTAGLLPVWVLALAVVRYALLLVGGACLYLFLGPVRIRPTHFGRLTGVVMSALVALLVLLFAMRGDHVSAITPLTVIALGVLMSLAIAQAVAMGWYNLRVMTRRAEARGRVVGDVRWDAR
jgi:cardiolipin synthase